MYKLRAPVIYNGCRQATISVATTCVGVATHFIEKLVRPLTKRGGSMAPQEPPLDPPLHMYYLILCVNKKLHVMLGYNYYL